MDAASHSWASEVPAPTRTEEPEYGIRDISEMLGISFRTIRFYEQKGLVSPKRAGRYRVYADADIERLKFVQNFRRIGLTIREINALSKELDAITDPARRQQIVAAYLENRLTEIRLDLDHLKEQETAVSDMLKTL